MKCYSGKPASTLKIREFFFILAPVDSTITNPLLRRSRHANSTLDFQSDFNTRLRSIKFQDGHISELFPINLRELFSYDGEQHLSCHGLNDAYY